MLATLAALLPARAFARSNGSATQGCRGCHSGGQTPTVLVTPDITRFGPGQVLKLTVSVSPTNGDAAGFYLESSVGTLSVVDSGTKLSGKGVTHSATRTAASGPITFNVGWTAPATPGGVDFTAWGNSADGDRTSRGDGEGIGFYSVAFGCTGRQFYHDYDGDGFGAESSGYTVACSLPPLYSAALGDCNDNDPNMVPGNAEICDRKDNDCDGEVDEGLAIVSYCRDADLDGHGVSGAATMSGCAPSKGFGSCDDDCNDDDAAIYPGATELCNDRDDNCNDHIDENARLVCGVGWCAQYAAGCTSTCTPGSPRVEECNDFDDDCDGVNDNGSDLALCGQAGLVCRAGYCVGDGTGGLSGTSGTSGGNDRGPAGGGCSFSRAANGRPWLALTALLALLARRLRRRLRAGPQIWPARPNSRTLRRMAHRCEVCESFRPRGALEAARELVELSFGERSVRLCRGHAGIARNSQVSSFEELRALYAESEGKRSYVARRSTPSAVPAKPRNPGRRAADLAR